MKLLDSHSSCLVKLSMKLSDRPRSRQLWSLRFMSWWTRWARQLLNEACLVWFDWLSVKVLQSDSDFCKFNRRFSASSSVHIYVAICRHWADQAMAFQLWKSGTVENDPVRRPRHDIPLPWLTDAFERRGPGHRSLGFPKAAPGRYLIFGVPKTGCFRIPKMRTTCYTDFLIWECYVIQWYSMIFICIWISFF